MSTKELRVNSSTAMKITQSCSEFFRREIGRFRCVQLSLQSGESRVHGDVYDKLSAPFVKVTAIWPCSVCCYIMYINSTVRVTVVYTAACNVQYNILWRDRWLIAAASYVYSM
jgi:hypothetical protein